VRLFEDRVAPNPRRVRIFLAEKGTTGIECVQVGIGDGSILTAEFLRRNPLAQVPVLELDDGAHLSDSIAICRYLEHLYPQPSLFGAPGLDAARVEMWNRRMEFEIFLADRQRVPAHPSVLQRQAPAGAGIRRSVARAGTEKPRLARRGACRRQAVHCRRPVHGGRHHGPVRHRLWPRQWHPHRRRTTAPIALAHRSVGASQRQGLSARCCRSGACA